MTTLMISALLAVSTGLPAPYFIRGDATQDGQINGTDATLILNHIFNGTPVGCEDSCDFQDDEDIDMADSQALLAFVYNGAPPPSAPYPSCGADPSGTALDCEEYASCD